MSKILFSEGVRFSFFWIERFIEKVSVGELAGGESGSEALAWVSLLGS